MLTWTMRLMLRSDVFACWLLNCVLVMAVGTVYWIYNDPVTPWPWYSHPLACWHCPTSSPTCPRTLLVFEFATTTERLLIVQLFLWTQVFVVVGHAVDRLQQRRGDCLPFH